MPTYEYKCRCGKIEEIHHSLEVKVTVVCLRCQQNEIPMIRQISTGTSFVLKGDGWANKGYSKGAGK